MLLAICGVNHALGETDQRPIVLFRYIEQISNYVNSDSLSIFLYLLHSLDIYHL